MVRHAESVWNQERRVQGTCRGIPLSELGRRQALLLGRRLSELTFSSVYCSDAERAVETAHLALGEDHPITIMHDLRELSLGEWEGRLISEIRDELPDMIERWYRNPTSVKVAGFEDLIEFRRRVVETMGKIIDDSDSGDLVVITHGGVICSYLTHLFNMAIDDLWSFSLPNASITKIVLDFRPRLRSFGDTSHLDGGALGLDGMPSSL
jgi:broad specificity phosphatase PhoE